MKLDITNVSKIVENGVTLSSLNQFSWIKVAPLPDRYTFHIQSNNTQTIYYLDLHRFSEHQNGTYRLMITNSKYRDDDNKKWISVRDIRDIDGFKGICTDLIRKVSGDEPPF
jgi:hypothetical protein